MKQLKYFLLNSILIMLTSASWAKVREEIRCVPTHILRAGDQITLYNATANEYKTVVEEGRFGLVARLNPQSDFIGLDDLADCDVSVVAEGYIHRCTNDLKNVEPTSSYPIKVTSMVEAGDKVISRVALDKVVLNWQRNKTTGQLEFQRLIIPNKLIGTVRAIQWQRAGYRTLIVDYGSKLHPQCSKVSYSIVEIFSTVRELERFE